MAMRRTLVPRVSVRFGWQRSVAAAGHIRYNTRPPSLNRRAAPGADSRESLERSEDDHAMASKKPAKPTAKAKAAKKPQKAAAKPKPAAA